MKYPFQGCNPGYTGENCSTPCPYPYYGVGCQRTCKCSKNKCNMYTGCMVVTTSNSTFLYHNNMLTSPCLTRLYVEILLLLISRITLFSI